MPRHSIAPGGVDSARVLCRLRRASILLAMLAVALGGGSCGRNDARVCGFVSLEARQTDEDTSRTRRRLADGSLAQLVPVDPDPDSGQACTWRLRRAPEDGPPLYDVTACTSTVPFRLGFEDIPLPEGSLIVWGRFYSESAAGSVAEVTVLPDTPESVTLELHGPAPAPDGATDRGFRARFTASGDLVWAQEDVQWFRVFPVVLPDGSEVYCARVSTFGVRNLKRVGVQGLGRLGGDDCLILRLDNQGELLWQTTLRTRGHTPFSIRPFTDGSLLVFGYYDGLIEACGDVPLNVYSIKHKAFFGGYDFFLIKIAQDGTMAWARFIGSTGLDEEIYYDYVLGEDGSVLVLGLFADKVEVSRGQPDSVVLSDGIFELNVALMAAKFDADGSLLWAEVCGSGWSDFSVEPTGEENRYLVTGNVRDKAWFTRPDGSSITFPADGQGGPFEAIFQTRE